MGTSAASRSTRTLVAATLISVFLGTGLGAILARREPARSVQPAYPAAPEDVPTDLPADLRLSFRHLGSALGDLQCAACHALPEPARAARSRAPDLSEVRLRLSAIWLVDWLKDGEPQSLRGRMHEFGLTADEARAVAAFLWQQPDPPNAPLFPPKDASFHPRDRSATGDHFDDAMCMDCHVATGRMLVESVGCLSCHRIDKTGGTVGPDLTRVGEKLRYPFLTRWMIDPEAARPGTAMPNLRLALGEARCIAAYLVERIEANAMGCSPEEIQAEITALLEPAEPQPGLPRDAQRVAALKARKREQTLLETEYWRCRQIEEDKRARELGDTKLAESGRPVIERVGCAACHAIQGIGAARPAPAADLTWGAFDRAHLPDAKGARGAKDGVPSYRLDADETMRLREWLGLIARHGAEAASLAGVSPTARAMVYGREQVDRHYCTACHEIVPADEAVLAPIQAHAPKAGAVAGGCPSLADEGIRVRREWLLGFLATPHAIRPTVSVAMPKFTFAPGEAEKIADFFRAWSGKLGADEATRWVADAATRVRAKDLFEKSGCAACHVPVKDRRGNVSLKAPLLSEVKDRAQSDWLDAWLQDPKALHPGTAMPQVDRTPVQRRELAYYLLSRPEEIVARERGFKVGERHLHHGH